MRVGPALAITLALVAAATLEVAGDAAIRVGVRERSLARVALGGALLAGYGVAVNLVPWDFARLLGTYVAVFALVAVLVGRFGFGDTVPLATWVGLACIVLGGSVMQFGR